MSIFVAAMGMALWFGILTSISPCPLATNIAAVSYIGRRPNQTGYALSAGVLYALGRMITYVILGVVLVSSTQSIPQVANFLQRYMNIILGPLLFFLGVVLLDLLPVTFGGISIFANRLQGRVENAGIWGAGILGIVFALSFCPVSAALFFGSLFSLAVNHESTIIIPALYGIGTAIPVLVFALLIAISTSLVGRAYNAVTLFALWAKRITALVFMGAGILYGVKYIVPLF
ncbi:MAG: sulfite exporter TauE/SafE family protein [Deltaproteobacteria bacterium]|nr:sulfite exporter TauE/SafE family protein [Deltaproteobacteria bacterium]MBN2846717.1 sulfite exporter TauE/SafE family protein [Deltaproteobacteria bacterium]